MRKRKVDYTVTPEMRELLLASGDNDANKAILAQRQLAMALMLPLRQGILDGDIVGPMGIFTSLDFSNNNKVEFPLDFISPGSEDEYSAFTIPNYGRIPEKHVEGDYVTVPTYDVGAAIDFHLKYARDARWDILSRAMQVMEAMFRRKMNLDAWRCILATGVDRNLLVNDSTAPAGFFTKRLVSLMKTQMRRSGGGNLASLNPIELTDIFTSPENMEDIRTWDLTQIDDVTRRQVFLASGNGGLSNIFGVDLHELTELGVNQTFQTYFTNLGGSLAASDTELVIGLDLTDNAGSSFVMPIKAPLEIFEDPTLHRQRRQGYYGWQEHGFAILDNRKVMFGSN